MGIEQNTLRFLNDFKAVAQNLEIVLPTQYKKLSTALNANCHLSTASRHWQALPASVTWADRDMG